jgi:hypothetical protein
MKLGQHSHSGDSWLGLAQIAHVRAAQDLRLDPDPGHHRAGKWGLHLGGRDIPRRLYQRRPRAGDVARGQGIKRTPRALFYLGSRKDSEWTRLTMKLSAVASKIRATWFDPRFWWFPNLVCFPPFEILMNFSFCWMIFRNESKQSPSMWPG